MKGSLTLVEKSSNDSLLPDGISRRDFVNGTLVGFGAALLTSSIPTVASSKVKAGVVNDPWTGYGGIGDYANSNGNVVGVTFAVARRTANDSGPTGYILDELEAQAFIANTETDKEVATLDCYQ